MTRGGAKDLTNGKPIRLILEFAITLLFGFLCQKLYNVVDTAIVGRILGANSLSAVGCTGPVNFLIIGFINGLCTGFAIPVAQRFGAGAYSDMRKTVQNGARLSAAVGVLLGVVTGLLCPEIMRLMNTPEEILDEAVLYIRVIFLAIPVTVLYNMASGILRSLGDSRTPVTFVILASFLNVALDLLMVGPLRMGVVGAAVATVISQLFSGVGCLTVLIRKFRILRSYPEEKQVDLPVMGRLLAIGIPTGLQFSFTAVGSIVLQYFVNGLGTVSVGAVTAGIRISLFCTCFFDALETTVSAFTGQNVGAGKPERVREGLRCTLSVGAVYAVFIGVMLWFFGGAFAGIFLRSTEAEMIGKTWQFLRVSGTLYTFLLCTVVIRSCIQGMGYTWISMLTGVVEMTFRVLVSSIMIPRFGYDAACFGHPTSWVFATVFLIPCYFLCLRKLQAKAAKGPAVPEEAGFATDDQKNGGAHR